MWELWWLWAFIVLLALVLVASQWPHIVLSLMLLAAVASTLWRISRVS